MKTYLYRASNLKSIITFLDSVSWWKTDSGDLLIIIRECGSAPYLGLQQTTLPISCNFLILLLLLSRYLKRSRSFHLKQIVKKLLLLTIIHFLWTSCFLGRENKIDCFSGIFLRKTHAGCGF